MALIKCSECNGQISDKATACPHCGNPIIISHDSSEDDKEVPIEKTVELATKLAEGNLLLDRINQSELKTLIEMITENNNAELASQMLHLFNGYNSSKANISPEQTGQLKRVILEAKNPNLSCEVIINLSRLFTEKEKDILRVSAATTTSPIHAFKLYKEEYTYLEKHRAAKTALRNVVVNTNDPQTAILFLKEAPNNLAAEADEWTNSLAFTPREIDRFKQVVFSTKNLRWALELLQAAERKPESEDYDEFDDYDPVELTLDERNALKRLVIESRNPDYAYTALRSISLSESERMILKEIMIQTKDPSLACQILCYNDGIPQLSRDEHTRLRQLASQVQDPFSARSALERIFDLTPDERAALEAVSTNI